MFQAVIIYVLSACLRTCDLVIFAIAFIYLQSK